MSNNKTVSVDLRHLAIKVGNAGLDSPLEYRPEQLVHKKGLRTAILEDRRPVGRRWKIPSMCFKRAVYEALGGSTYSWVDGVIIRRFVDMQIGTSRCMENIFIGDYRKGRYREVVLTGEMRMRHYTVHVGGIVLPRVVFRLEDWTALLPVRYDAAKVSERTVLEVLEVAGSAIGIGVHRMSKGCNGGAFKLMSATRKSWVQSPKGKKSDLKLRREQVPYIPF